MATIAVLLELAGCTTPSAPGASFDAPPATVDAATRPADGGAAADAGAAQADARSPDAASSPPDGPVTGGSCERARLTYYDVSGAGACEVMDVPSALPPNGRAGLTAAIAEPWWGGSLGGPPGEACGECWEITTAHATRTVVVTDLCPIEGNPVCAGGFFHFDLAGSARATRERWRWLSWDPLLAAHPPPRSVPPQGGCGAASA